MEIPECDCETAEQLAHARVEGWSAEDFYNYTISAMMEEYYQDEEIFKEDWTLHLSGLPEVPERFKKSIF